MPPPGSSAIRRFSTRRRLLSVHLARGVHAIPGQCSRRKHEGSSRPPGHGCDRHPVTSSIRYLSNRGDVRRPCTRGHIWLVPRQVRPGGGGARCPAPGRASLPCGGSPAALPGRPLSIRGRAVCSPGGWQAPPRSRGTDSWGTADRNGSSSCSGDCSAARRGGRGDRPGRNSSTASSRCSSAVGWWGPAPRQRPRNPALLTRPRWSSLAGAPVPPRGGMCPPHWR